ncbi:hypothetical protein GVAV_002758 [Gurleya vavrai]
MPIYDDLSIYAGGNNIENRLNALKELKDENIILAISSTLDKDLEEYSDIKEEKISYMINLDSDSNMNNDLLTNLHHSILHVLTVLFGFNVPNLLDKKRKEEREIFTKNIIKLAKEKKKQSKEINIEEENNKSNLMESDAIVNQFDKIMTLLKKKDLKEDISENEEDKKSDNSEMEEKKESNKDTENEKTDGKKVDKKDNVIGIKKDDKKEAKKDSADKLKKDDNELKSALKEVVSELKNLRSDIADATFRRNDFPPRYVDREFVTSKRSFNTPYRHYEDFKNENIISMPIVDKKSKEFQPFNFKDKKLTTSDLKLNNEPKSNN